MTPRRSLLAFLLFALFFYVLPFHAALRAAYAPLIFDLPTFGLAGLPAVVHAEINVRYALAMVLFYVLVFALVALALRVLRAYHWDGAVHWLATVTSIKDLLGMDRLLIWVSALTTLAFVMAIPFWHTEEVAVLAGLAWFSMAANKASQPAKVTPVLRPEPMQPLPRVSEPDGDVSKQYTWEYPKHTQGGQQLSVSLFTVELLLSNARYAEYRERARELDTKHWDLYVTAPIVEVEVLAGKLLSLGRERGYCSLEQACNTLAFTQQCIRYEPDRSPDTGDLAEYPKYPIESLMEEAGDCEDQAILTAALLKRMGYDVALLLCPGHAAVGVAGAEGLPGTYVEDPATGVRFFYAETTADSWHLGELPDDLEPYLAKGQFEVVPVILCVS